MAFPTNPTDGQIYKNKKYNSGKSVWENSFIPPIGFIYIQLPNKPDPSTLYGGTWSNISTSFAGDFLRIEGGNASSFNSGRQSGMNASHSHVASSGPMSANASHSHIQYTGTRDDGNFTSGTNQYPPGDGPGQNDTNLRSGTTNTDHTHAVTVNADGGLEARPQNQTIRIWERTA